MITEFGHFALILAFLVACVQAVAPLVGAHTNRYGLMALASRGNGTIHFIGRIICGIDLCVCNVRFYSAVGGLKLAFTETDAL